MPELSSCERAKRYRQLAEEAERAAQTTHEPTSQSYRRIARQWRELAADIEVIPVNTDIPASA